ncbi:MAG: metallophosphoesterase family protein [Methylocystis sp.]|uniref:metallophosphoesterase family protein n=1 Tax=Methylocystis sp. TaxID=1911079 RepID=UPI003DA4E914
MDTFKFIHISDLHIGSDPGRLHVWDYLRVVAHEKGYKGVPGLVSDSFYKPTSHDDDIAHKLARFIFENQEDVDLLLVSGDIARTGVPADLSAALAYFEGKHSHQVPFQTGERMPTLAGAGLSLFLLPGNHDRYANDLGVPAGNHFDAIFGRYWDTGIRGTKTALLRHSDADDHLAFIAADFSLRSESECIGVPWFSRWGQGMAGEDTLEELVEKTKDHHEKGHGVVWVCHFPPTEPAEFTLRLNRWSSVISAAKECGVEHIFSGHLHRCGTFEESGIKIICAGSGTAFLERAHGNWVHTITVEVEKTNVRILNKSDFRWNSSRKAFEASV